MVILGIAGIVAGVMLLRRERDIDPDHLYSLLEELVTALEALAPPESPPAAVHRVADSQPLATSPPAPAPPEAPVAAPAQEWAAAAAQLAAAGIEPDEIARRLHRPQGEVDLVLALGRIAGGKP